ncbi:MAG: HAMP domain-containing histidine kinase [Campylobacteraceae bacterium]|nr:HAMP domain-containing histidine kinase [Campylobacteraceae bacterium]
MKKEIKHALSYAFFYTTVIIFITAIPIYAYVSISMEYSKFRQEQELKAYALELEQLIYEIPDQASVFVYPRSLLYRSAIFNKKNEPLFTLLIDEPTPSEEGIFNTQKRLIYRHNLNTNILEANYLVVSRSISYKKVLLDAFILTGIVSLFVFLFSLLVLYKSFQPFEEAARQMDRFFKDAMHELKTPLGVIRLNLEMLGEQLGKNRSIERANSALILLSTVYEDIEYLIKHRRVEYGNERFEAGEALRGRIEFFKDLFHIKNIDLSKEINSNIYLYMNRQEWQRVIDNTLSNAIKYTLADGKIDICLKTEENRAILIVKDNGIGIENGKKIFHRYYRGDAIKGGFGIGLNIVKQICEKYNIILLVESEKGKGSTFTYKFPLA